MLERRSLRSLGWVSGLLVMACSGTYVGDVGDAGGAAGQGGSDDVTSQGGTDTSPAGAGGESTVPQAGQGGAGEDPVLTPACSDCTVDVLGPAERLYTGKSNTVSANVVDVTSTRVLREIHATLQIPKRTSAAWVVFEETGGQYVLRLDVPTKLDPASGVFSSGPIELLLEAGHRYAIGVYLNVGACFDSDAPETNQLSFGTVKGQSFNGGGDYHDINHILPSFGAQFAMRLYTSEGNAEPFVCPSDDASLEALNGQPCSQEGQECFGQAPECAPNRIELLCDNGAWMRIWGDCAPGGAAGSSGAP